MADLMNKDFSVRIVKVLFFIAAIIWVVFGAISLARISKSDSAHAIIHLVIAVLMFGNAGALLVSGIGIGSERRFFYFLSMAVLIVNIILTFTDEFGLFDFLTLLIDCAIFTILIFKKDHFTGQKEHTS